MNARLYDPVIARFLSADSLIPEPNNPMAYNRYIYVTNNPLKYTDPDGHWIQFVIGAIIYAIGATSDDPTISKVGMIVGSVMMGAELGTPVAEGGSYGWSAASTGAAVGFTTSMISSGGDIEQGARGATSGAIIGSVQGKYGDTYNAERVAAVMIQQT